MSDFVSHVKSTLDKAMTDAVTALSSTYPTLKGVEVDNLMQTDEVMKGTSPALLWQLLTVAPHPRDPLYRVEFLIGVKTVSDAGNYLMSALMAELGERFPVGGSLAVGDYSGSTAVTNTGYIVFGSMTMVPQQYDHMSGYRFYSMVAVGARTV